MNFQRRVQLLKNMIESGEFSLALSTVKSFVKIRIHRAIPLQTLKAAIQNQSIQTREGFHPELSNYNGPLLSVVIPHVNYTHYLERCVDSILNSSFPGIEVVVVESESSESHKARFNEIVMKYREVDNVKFLYTTRSKPGNNRNYGIKKSSGYFIVCIDPDDEVRKEYFEIAIFQMINRCLDLSGAAIEIVSEEFDYIYQPPKKVRSKQMLLSNNVSGQSIFTRTIFEKSGGYLEQKLGDPHIHEDWYLWQRMLKLGARSGHVQFPLSVVNFHGTNLSKSRNVPDKNWQINEISKLNADVKKKKFQLREQNLDMLCSLQELCSLGNMLMNVGKLKRTVLVFLPFLDQSGVTTATIPLLEILKDADFEIIIVCTELIPDSLVPLKVDFTTFYFGREINKSDEVRFVSYLLKSRKIEFIWIIGSKWMYQHLELINTREVKVIDSIFNVNSVHMESSVKNSIDIERTIFESKTVENEYFEREGNSKTCVLPNTVDIKPLDLSHKFTKSRIKKVAFVGRLAPEKDPISFCRVVMQLLPMLKDDCDFVIHGTGPLERTVQRFISDNSLPIRLAGHSVNMEYVWDGIHVHVLTSKNDGRPNSILEAMSRGVPTVAYDVGAISEMFTDELSGFVIPRPAEKLMAEKISHLLNDQEILFRFSKDAYTEAKEKHQRRLVLPTLERIFSLEPGTLEKLDRFKL